MWDIKNIISHLFHNKLNCIKKELFADRHILIGNNSNYSVNLSIQTKLKLFSKFVRYVHHCAIYWWCLVLATRTRQAKIHHIPPYLLYWNPSPTSTEAYMMRSSVLWCGILWLISLCVRRWDDGSSCDQQFIYYSESTSADNQTKTYAYYQRGAGFRTYLWNFHAVRPFESWRQGVWKTQVNSEI